MDLDHHTIPKLMNHHTIPKLMKSQKKNKGKRKSSSLKVVYISSPMKVKTSASRFRSLVQHLTGKNSDISQYINDDNMNQFCEIGCDDYNSERFSSKENSVEQHHQVLSSISSRDDTPTSSETFLGAMDSMFGTQIEDVRQFGGLFSSYSFFDASQLDVLGSYDELL